MVSTILVADDDRAIRMVLNQALVRLGHDVRLTGNDATLWRWITDGEGDLVITDVIMPDENGLDLIPRIKKIRPDLRIIVMSAQNTLSTAVKATERGASALLPVWTARTQSERLNLERWRARAVEAAEQSERLSVPELRSPEVLGRVLSTWPAERPLIVCDESGAGEPISEAAARVAVAPVALLVGPEGGFDQTELDALGKLSFVTRDKLDCEAAVLERANVEPTDRMRNAALTAALAALAVFQAIGGDWRRIRTR